MAEETVPNEHRAKSGVSHLSLGRHLGLVGGRCPGDIQRMWRLHRPPVTSYSFSGVTSPGPNTTRKVAAGCRVAPALPSSQLFPSPPPLLPHPVFPAEGQGQLVLDPGGGSAAPQSLLCPCSSIWWPLGRSCRDTGPCMLGIQAHCYHANPLLWSVSG